MRNRAFPLAAAMIVAALVTTPGCRGKEQPPASPAKPVAPQGSTISAQQLPLLKKLKTDVVTLEPFNVAKTFTFTPEYRQTYTAVTFPFPFIVKEVSVKKGDPAEKGNPVVLIESEALAASLAAENGDPGTAAKLASLGLSPGQRASSMLMITTPVTGIFAEVAVEAGTSYPAGQRIAVVQTAEGLKLKGILPAEYAGRDMTYQLVNGEQIIPLTIAATEIKETSVGLTLLLATPEAAGGRSQLTVTAVTTHSLTFTLPDRAAVRKDGAVYCLVNVAGDLFERREVRGFHDGGRFIVTDGLRDTERVVTDAIPAAALDGFK